MQTLKALKWFWDDFDTFKSPFLLPTAWIKCSKGWFQHQVRNALRQVQMSTLASRATHYFGLQFFDRDSTIFLLSNLLSKKQSYAAGALKAILANAVRAAVVFHKCGAGASAICPFCSSEVVEDTHHLCDVCPKWQPIRDKWSKNAYSQLPLCTLHTGVASLPPQAQAVLAAGIPPDNLTCSNCTFSTDDLALEAYTASGHVAVTRMGVA